MLSSFVIVLREGFEAFLIVAIVLAYLRKSGGARLIPIAYAGVVVSLLASAALGFLLEERGISSFTEAVLGFATVPLVAGLVVHMWKTGPTLKRRMEDRLEETTSRPSILAALGVFIFTVLMIGREGVETALMLFQVRSPQWVEGAALGAAGAGAMAWAWAQYGHRINMRRFFQVTGVFLLLFVAQIAVSSLHELSEAFRPASEALARFHELSEPYSSEGRYGKWFSIVMVAVPAVWLLFGVLRDRLVAPPAPRHQA